MKHSLQDKKLHRDKNCIPRLLTCTFQGCMQNDSASPLMWHSATSEADESDSANAVIHIPRHMKLIFEPVTQKTLKSEKRSPSDEKFTGTATSEAFESLSEIFHSEKSLFRVKLIISLLLAKSLSKSLQSD